MSTARLTLVSHASTAALRAALIERATPYWIADKRVAEHTVTWDAEGEPLIDGARLYVPSPGVGQEPLL